MKQLTLIIVCVIVVYIVCFGGSSQADPIYIGLSEPFSGQYAGYGEMFKKAIDLAISEVNEEGGIEGRPLELIVEDSEGDPNVSKRIARKFTRDERIVAEIGDFTSTCCMAAQAVYDRGHLVQLSPTASHPAFASGSPYSFAVFGTQDVEAPFMARTAVNRLGKKKLAVLYINNDWGSMTHQFFVDEAQQLGAELVAVEGYYEGTTDFTGILEKIRAANPEVLFLCLMYQDGVTVSKQRHEMGWDDVIVMGSVPLYTPETIELGGEAVENLITNTTFFPNDPRPEVQQFVSGFQTRYGSQPNVFAAVAYDALKILVEAIKKRGPDRKAIRDELAEIENFPGVTGVMSFDEHGNVVRELTLLQIKNGEFVLYAD